jgi:hypothetical protein
MLHLPELKLDHLFQLTDSTGIFQHARYHISDRNHGYCLDDNARALILMSLLKKQGIPLSQLEKWMDIYLSFMDHAYHPKTKKYRNFMSYSREWLEDAGSDDCQGRTMWAIGTLYADEDFRYYHPFIEKLVHQSLEIDYFSPLSTAYCLLGLSKMAENKALYTSEIKEKLEKEADKLWDFFQVSDAKNWHWFTDVVTYDSCRIPQAMMEAGFILARPHFIKLGLKILDWLINCQFENGIFMPIGNDQWMTPFAKANYDQQPLEATSMIDACLKAGNLTQNSKYFQHATQAFFWYLGKNTHNEFLYDPFTGGCRDGLGIHGSNKNQGAESTLAWLSSLLTVKINQDLLLPKIQKNLIYESP